MERLYGPGDHILRNSTERIVKRSDGRLRLRLFDLLTLLEQSATR